MKSSLRPQCGESIRSFKERVLIKDWILHDHPGSSDPVTGLWMVRGA